MTRIYGIGTDIVSINRMAAALGRHGDQFARRILAPREWEEYQALPGRDPRQAPTFLAKRFAAKEAAVKALGTGFRDGINLPTIWVDHDQWGRPLLEFSAAAAAACQTRNICQALLSLTDEKDYALAFVTLMADQKIKTKG